MRATLRNALLGLCCGVLVAGCERSAQEQPAPAQPAGAQTEDERAHVRDLVADRNRPAAPDMTGLPPGHPPIDNVDLTAPPPAESGGQLTYSAPEGWRSVPPASSIREAQFVIPRSEGDDHDGELIVFYFGPSGAGGVDANIDRWIGQFRTPEGDPIPEGGYSRRVMESNGLTVALVEVEGTYNAGMAVGGVSEDQDGYRLLGAIVATPVGPWYFKGAGPAKTMDDQRDNFMALLETVRFEEE